MKSSSSRPDVVVGKSGADGGPEAETTAQAAGDVVFAAAFPDLELAGAADAAFAGVEAEHDFPQRNQIIFARTCRFDVQNCHNCHI